MGGYATNLDTSSSPDSPSGGTPSGGGAALSNPSTPSAPTGTTGTGTSGTGGSGGSGGGVVAATAGVGMSDNPILMGAGGVPVNGPNRYILPDEVVEVVPIPTNTQPCFLSVVSPETAKNGPNRIYLPANTSIGPRTLTVRSLNEIWLYSTVVGEGVIVEVRKRAR